MIVSRVLWDAETAIRAELVANGVDEIAIAANVGGYVAAAAPDLVPDTTAGRASDRQFASFT